MTCSKCSAVNASPRPNVGGEVLCINCMLLAIKQRANDRRETDTGIKCIQCGSVNAEKRPMFNAELCAACYDSRLKSKQNEIINDQKLAENKSEFEREVEDKIRRPGDLFNAKLTFIESIREKVSADESIPVDKRKDRFFEILEGRYRILSQAIFDREALNHEDAVEKYAINETLQKYVSDVRLEIREKIREADLKYQPEIRKPVKPKVAAPVNVMDRAVQALATAKGITLAQAREQIEKGLAAKEAKDKTA